MTAHSETITCWVVTDGRAGIESQALGLAEAVARLMPLAITQKRIEIKAPWKKAPRSVWGDPFSRLSPAGALLRPPFPDLWIACGRLSTPLTRAVKLRDARVFTVQIQDPRMGAAAFDLVIPPYHDNLKGENVFPLIGSPNRVTPQALAADAETLGEAIGPFPSPRAALLVGGPNRVFTMDAGAAMRIARIARTLVRRKVGVLATTSRRTPPEVGKLLTRALAGFPHFLWDGAPVGGLANPYFGMLGMADHILVTEDSVNMAAEAAMTGKPVHVIALGRAPVAAASAMKFDRFHAGLREYGAARLYDGALQSWTYPPLVETARAAEEVARRFLATAPNIAVKIDEA